MSQVATRARPVLFDAEGGVGALPPPKPVPARSRVPLGDAATRAGALAKELATQPPALDGDRAIEAAVRLDPKVKPMSREAFRGVVVRDALDRMTMLARHRDERPLSLRASREERILAQLDAVRATGEGGLARLVARAAAAIEDEPYALYSAAFVLGCVAGHEGLSRLGDVFAQLSPEAVELPAVAGDALSSSPHADLIAFARDWLHADSPVARAVGLDLLARRRALSIERVVEHLRAPEGVVVATAARALASFPELVEAPGDLVAALDREEPEVAWQAARALTRLGKREAVDRVRRGDPLASTLGVRAGEVLVMIGDVDDAELLARLLGRFPADEAVLSIVARFGDAGAFGFLAHYLADDELAEPAERALVTLFGARVPLEDRRVAGAWRSAIEEARFDRRVRLRAGKPYARATVVAELAHGALTRVEAEAWLDELSARTGERFALDLSLFWPDLEPALRAVTRAPRK